MRNFDHDKAGWSLKGRHATVPCENCHKKKNRQGLRVFLGEDQLCGSCHKKDQPHNFDRRAMMHCERCHTQGVWKPPKRKLDFNHNSKKDAAVGLVGNHADVACAKCHPRAKFNLGRKNADLCGHCHKSPHKRHLFDKNCERCHSPKNKSLEKFSFNHDRTRFKLSSAHRDVACYTCHTKSRGTRKPSKRCKDCHKSDSPHGNRFKQFGNPPACEICHKATSWKAESIFNHNRRTKFKLVAKHAVAECKDCHRGKTPDKFEKFSRRIKCMDCHAHKNVHDREYKNSQCTKCHKTPGNPNLKRPDKLPAFQEAHGKNGSFKLVKKHSGVTCRKCHKNPKTGKTTYKNTPTECGPQCHKDFHQGRLGKTCSKCHTPGSWWPYKFDHDRDTQYPLIGLHKTVPKCQDCHQKKRFANTPTNCSASGCHKSDDAHNGALGDRCEKCHVETGEITFNHNTMSRYPLEGQHLKVACSSCHKTVDFKPLATNCFSCHEEPKVHKGKFGTVCETCHNTSSFKNIKPLHDVGSFSLNGQHDQVDCERCHKNNRALAGTGDMCITCHRQDDIHNNSLSPRCGECHSQFSFAPAQFDHTGVGCNLSGLHRTLPCFDCHRSGNFIGLSPQCVSCHANDTQRANHGLRSTCTGSGCHNTTTWAPGNGTGRDSICR